MITIRQWEKLQTLATKCQKIDKNKWKHKWFDMYQNPHILRCCKSTINPNEMVFLWFFSNNKTTWV
jgi:hypothetical protein